jgi:hypothetical protein
VIGNGRLALLTHQEQMYLLQTHPELIATAVEEFLHSLTPIALTTNRRAREEVELLGKQISRGEGCSADLPGIGESRRAGAWGARDGRRMLARRLAKRFTLMRAHTRPIRMIISPLRRLQRLPHMQLSVDPEALVWQTGSTVPGRTTCPWSSREPGLPLNTRHKAIMTDVLFERSDCLETRFHQEEQP